jgi:hypothetical protein
MKSSSSYRGISGEAFRVLVAAGLGSGFLSTTASAQQPTVPAATAPSSPSAVEPHLLSPEGTAEAGAMAKVYVTDSGAEEGMLQLLLSEPRMA